MIKKMTTTAEHDERMAKMTFASLYPHYITKVEKILRYDAEDMSHQQN